MVLALYEYVFGISEENAPGEKVVKYHHKTNLSLCKHDNCARPIEAASKP